MDVITRNAGYQSGAMAQIVRSAGLAVALALLCLSAAGPARVPAAAAAQPRPEPTMSGPIRIADTPNGLMVGDYVGYGVMFLDPVTLAIEDTVPVAGKPLGVAWLNGRVYVGDERTGAIEVYQEGNAGKKSSSDERNGKNTSKWKQVFASLTGFAIGGPADIVADETLGLLFIASKRDKTVYVVDEAGFIIRAIGGPTSPSPVGRPQGLALDPVGERLFVSDDGADVCTWMGCSPKSLVHVYDYYGNFLGEISGDSGQANFQFSRVQGVTLDSTGRVYLVDSWRGQVLVFEEIGANVWSGIGTFGSKGAGIKELLLPMDVVVDEASATVYVTNTMKGRVEVFSFEDMVP